MEYDVEKKEIKSEKELNELDKFILDFTSYLEEYVIISGYVAIVLGRSRGTEDIDLLIPKMSFEKFSAIWKKLFDNGFECINTSKVEEAFDMLKGHAVRFFRGIPLPNVEFKIIKNDLDKYSFDNRIKLILNGGTLYISPLELQIAYKLFLDSEKDIEDAKHIFKVFKEKINKDKLFYFLNLLKVENKFKVIDQNGNRFRNA